MAWTLSLAWEVKPVSSGLCRGIIKMSCFKCKISPQPHVSSTLIYLFVLHLKTISPAGFWSFALGAAYLGVFSLWKLIK